jgi:hypothetical protein
MMYHRSRRSVFRGGASSLADSFTLSFYLFILLPRREVGFEALCFASRRSYASDGVVAPRDSEGTRFF